MDISVKTLQEAISIRRQIDDLEKRLSSILAGAPARAVAPRGGRYFSPGTRAKLSAAARARWARQRGTATAAPTRKKNGQITPAGRRKLSQLMKARWAARRKAGGTKKAPAKKKGALTAAGRRKLSELMKARWAARRKAAAKK
ncbi:MAG: hypothetical protein DME90_07085 [Verrucomicrobia bacterium]|nr:MAG: hypothetical protein DME90_07085 [Verrucomicrobiota bacterium]